MTWSPPQHWRALPSAVEGVAVWGPPEPAEDAPAEPAATRCPRCGASARFEVAAGKLACRFCGWEDADAQVVGRSAEAGEFTDDALHLGAQGFGVDRRELGCETCGATLTLDAGALTASCPFCASNHVHVREHATVSGQRPTALVRFALQDTEAAAAAATWLGRGWLHPSDLARVARVDRFSGIYLPYWTFDADLNCSWRAEVGRSRTVRRWDASSKSFKTQTVIDWSWKTGQVRLPLRNVLVPGTTRVSEVLLERAGDFDLGALVDYAPSLLAGWSAQTYDRALPEAWERGRAAMRERGRSACYADTGSSHVRSFSMTADLDDEAWRHVLLPAWVSAYRFDERVFVVVVNGATGTVAGQKPVAWWKVYTAMALLLSPGICLGVVGIPLLLFGIGAFVLMAAFALLLAGVAGCVWVYSRAAASEAL